MVCLCDYYIMTAWGLTQNCAALYDVTRRSISVASYSASLRMNDSARLLCGMLSLQLHYIADAAALLDEGNALVIYPSLCTLSLY